MSREKFLLRAGKSPVPGTDSDKKYRDKMAAIFLPVLYTRHVEFNYTSCAFCRWLKKAPCHINCFICAKDKYDSCERLLPGIFANSASRLRLSEGKGIPWLFRAPCESFSRLSKSRYLQNFSYGDFNTKIWNLEIVEGLFCGLSNGNTPCHICAAVDKDIFNKCSLEKRVYEFETCSKILRGLYAWYGLGKSI